MFARSLGFTGQAIRARMSLKLRQPLPVFRPFISLYHDDSAAFDNDQYRERPQFQRQNSFRSTFNRGFDNRNGGFGGNRRSGFSNANQNSLGERLTAPRWENTELTEFKKDFYQPHEATEQRTAEEVNEYRRSNRIVVSDDAPKPILNFDELQIPEQLSQQILTKNFSKVTPIQAQGWPIALSGSNMVAIAQTGYEQFSTISSHPFCQQST